MYGISKCPLCGKSDKVWLTDKDTFVMIQKAFDNNPQAVTMLCEKCRLQLRSDVHDEYDEAVADVLGLWERLKYGSEQ